MAYTLLQKPRKARTTNKGLNKKMARALYQTADLLEDKGPEEFSRLEIRVLRLTAKQILQRLHTNDLTKEVQIAVDKVRKARQS